MNPAQLITELEKRGVLTWEQGDVAVYSNWHLIVIEVERGTNKGVRLSLNWAQPEYVKAADCTHSTDDPRLLGRVLLALGESIYNIGFHNCRDRWFCEFMLEGDLAPTYHGPTERKTEGDTLLEAALKALLAKVEGGD